MNIRQLASATWIVVCVAAACGGSGSSGFDAFSENATITQALEGKRCIERAGLDICPSGKGSVPRNRPGDPPLLVDVALDLTAPPACPLAASGDACVVEVPLVVVGLPAGGQLRVATRLVDPIAPWQAGTALDVPASLTRVTAAARFALAPATLPGTNVDVQVAVLAFRTPASEVGVQLDELADAGADAAFVTAVFQVAVAAPAASQLAFTGGGGME